MISRVPRKMLRATHCGSGNMGRLTADVMPASGLRSRRAGDFRQKERVTPRSRRRRAAALGQAAPPRHAWLIRSRARGGRVSLHRSGRWFAERFRQLAAPPQGASSGVDVGSCRRSGRRLAQAGAALPWQCRPGADVTAEFWRVGGELRAALPPLLLPGRPAEAIRGLAIWWRALPVEIHAVRIQASGRHALSGSCAGRRKMAPDTRAQVVDLRNRSELQAARRSRWPTRRPIDLDGAALSAAPLPVALRPARVIIEPLFEPVHRAFHPGCRCDDRHRPVGACARVAADRPAVAPRQRRFPRR
jgi:hypothetical protein